MQNKRTIIKEQGEKLFQILKKRFMENMNRHEGIDWQNVERRLEDDMEKLWSLNEMERTGGEPDVIDYDKSTDEYSFYDCSAESPSGRRSLCYDQVALMARKENKPVNSCVNMASEMGISLLDETQYRKLQTFGEFDNKTSSWIMTPKSIRTLGGALFCDRRYDFVFLYHNGADSYYAARGFRGALSI